MKIPIPPSIGTQGGGQQGGPDGGPGCAIMHFDKMIIKKNIKK